MAPIQPTHSPDKGEAADAGPGGESGPGRRKAVRYAVPIAVAGVAAATIGLVPALADSGNPDLPKITAEQLLTKIASSDTQALSGTVTIDTDLGIPAFAAGAVGGGGPFAGGTGSRGGEGSKDGSSADPKAQLGQLLAGSHTLHVAADGPDRQKISVLEDAAEYSVIRNGDQVWAYDSRANAVYHSTARKDASGTAGKDARGRAELPGGFPTTPQAAAQQVLKAADGTTSITVDGTAKVAGRSTYQLLVTPKDGDSTVGSVRIAVDSATGVPLTFTLTPKSDGKAAVRIGFTRVDFGKPSAATFHFTAPKGAKVTEDDSAAHRKGAVNEADATRAGLDGLGVLGTGWDSVAEIKTSKGALTRQHDTNGEGVSGESLLGSFGHHVTGSFGSGTVVGSRLVNALITDEGTVYVGAVTQEALVAAANAAAK